MFYMCIDAQLYIGAHILLFHLCSYDIYVYVYHLPFVRKLQK